MNQELFKELQKTRDKLQRKAKTHICDDDTLIEMARYLPLKPDHFHGIRGCGKAFVEKYADAFIEVISKHKASTEQKPINEEQKNFINRLENRLINISKRNPNLYLKSTTNANFFDIALKEDFNIVESLFFNKSKRVIELHNATNSRSDKKEFRDLSRLNRSLEKDLMESGEYNLYIAYPFAHGITPDKSFEINAPLTYFPVVLTKSSGRFTISPDASREIILNESFLIMAMKFIINKEIDIENTEVDFSEIQFNQFLDEIIKKYKHYNIEIEKSDESKTMPLDDDQFDLQTGLKIKEFMILGRFSSFANSIQHDINKIKTSGSLNTNAHRILFASEFQPLPADENIKWDVDQINQLDYSQLKVLNAVDRGQSIVIEGPPGTGKSQVIVSIITNTASKDQNVLMVAEKKAAIDVIYSRLKEIRDYAIIIDNPNNKKEFYNQMKHLLQQEIKQKHNASKEDKVRTKLESEIDEYENIIQEINDATRYNVSLTKLMERYEKISFTSDEARHYGFIRKLFKKHFENKTYERITELLETLYKENREDYETLFKIKEESPVITALKNDLDYTDFMNLTSILQRHKDVAENSAIFKRLFHRMVSKLKLIRYSKRRNHLIKHSLKTPLTDNDFNTYETYHSLKEDFDQLERSFRKFYSKLHDYQNKKNVTFTNTELESYYANFLIRNLQRDKKATIRKYSKTKRTIDQLYKYYKQLIKHNTLMLDNLLNTHSEEVKLMKRYSAMLKAINSKKLPNIASFIAKYEFEIFRLVRIWLMTPNGVSTLLPLRPDMFDLNIFDEASQMYFERSLPSLYRSKRSVIAGDEKQLRPSSFGFGRLEGINDEDYVLEEYSILDEESLLDFAKIKLPSVRLEYHYRSHFQELINISNYLFYNRDLVVPPYKNYQMDNSPLTYIKVENGLWKNNANRPEAIKVVDTLVELLKTTQNTKSIGIITFNIHQQELIENLIDDRLMEDEEFNSLYIEAKQKVEDNEQVGLFVKNVENVQGDQRDIILISVGYSYNEEGVFQRQFGWLSQKYGENRLNVCVSRSKIKTYIFVSFDLIDFNTKGLTNDGPRILKNYLQYAQLISNNQYDQSVEFINSLIEAEIEEDEPNTLFISEEEKMYKIFDVNGIKGTPVDYMLVSEDFKDGIGLLVHKPHQTFQRDYYFLEKYLQWIEAKHERINMFHFWENKEAYIESMIDRYKTKEQ